MPTPAPTPRRGRPKGSRNASTRDQVDEARLDLHDAADGLVRLDADLVRARLRVREAWSAVQNAALHLDTADHLPACEQAATLAVA